MKKTKQNNKNNILSARKNVEQIRKLVEELGIMFYIALGLNIVKNWQKYRREFIFTPMKNILKKTEKLQLDSEKYSYIYE